ncbi:MAG: TIGR02679 domain-containing protein [Longicatena sp.]
MIEEEFSSYLKANKGYARVMEAWIHQYKKLGHVGGRILIEQVTTLEKEAIGGFIGADYRKKEQLSISYHQWEKAMLNSRFSTADFDKVLLIYFGKELITNAQKRKLKIDTETQNFTALLNSQIHTKAYLWLTHIYEQKDASYLKVKELFATQQETTIQIVCKAINQLPFWVNQKETLPVFANDIAQDPHYFDKGVTNYLLFKAICFFLQMKESKEALSLEDKNKIYYDAGLIKDDFSNYCMICHINGVCDHSVLHPGWNGFYQTYEAWIVNLYNLQQIGTIDTQIKRVYIVENPSVFRAICLHAKSQNLSDLGFVCTNGQLNLSAFILLDLLASSNISMYYSGDFDPEGLLIADKLKQRYGKLLTLWQYTLSNYTNNKSGNCIDERRIAILTKCNSAEIVRIANEIRIDKQCAYQESLLPLYLNDIVKGRI